MSNGSKERKYPVTAIVIIAALAFAIMGTAAVYIKRTSNVDVKISDSSNVEGVPTAGFYIGSNSHLPGTPNPNATTYGDNKVIVRYSNKVYTSSGPPDINLYSRATINVNLTNGEWVLDKVIAVGIPGDACSGQSVTVNLVVEKRSLADEAKAKLYYRTSNIDNEYHYFGELDLTQTGDNRIIVTTVGDTGFAIYITLDLTYSYPGMDDFSIGVYISNS